MKSDPDLRYQALVYKLQIRGSRLTSQRLALARLLSVSENHPNASQLFEKLRIQFPTVSLATIYKTLALLKKEGEVLEIDLHGDSRYDGAKPFPHSHLICDSCGKIFDGDEAQAIRELHKEVEDKYGFQITHPQLNFYGLCRDCRDLI